MCGLPAGMHIAVGAVQPRRHFQHGDILRRLEMAGAARLNRIIDGFAQHHRHPADLQFRAGAHQQICALRALAIRLGRACTWCGSCSGPVAV